MTNARQMPGGMGTLGIVEMLDRLCKVQCKMEHFNNEMDLRKPAHSKIFVLHIFFRHLIIRINTVQTK